jgi:ribosomal protein S18 acetylase RimI-like enzyme
MTSPPTSAASPLVVAPATPAQLVVVLDILDEAARWLTDRGIDQWRPGSFAPEPIARRIAAGEVFLLYLTDEPVATLTLQPSDTIIWGEMPDDALYLHRLAIRRRVGGQGVGRRLLDWAADRAADAGKRYLRLDCMAENTALCAYYERAGFHYRGETRGKGWAASRYEKQVTG